MHSRNHRYTEGAIDMMANGRKTMPISFEDVTSFIPDQNPANIDLAQAISNDYYKYEPYLRKALHQFLFEKSEEEIKSSDIFDIGFYNLKATEK